MTKLTEEEVVQMAKECGASIMDVGRSITSTGNIQKNVYITEPQLQTLAAAIEAKVRAEYASGEPVGFWLVKCMGDWNLLHSEKEADYWVEQYKIDGGEPEVIKLYLAPPNYEALQAENKDLVEYALTMKARMKWISNSQQEAIEIKAYANLCLALPLPAAMKGE